MTHKEFDDACKRAFMAALVSLENDGFVVPWFKELMTTKDLAKQLYRYAQTLERVS
jgi:hypothetical protein